jgi:hypothetical protein
MGAMTSFFSKSLIGLQISIREAGLRQSAHRAAGAS